jgi:hypothetical protein
MPKEIVESFKDQINERLSSPLTGSFAIAWLIWNYKFIVILMSANTVTKTFELIHKICFPDLSSLILNGFLYPFLSTCIYIFLVPYPSRIAYAFTRNCQKVLTGIRQQIDDETPLTKEEAKKLRKELRAKEREVEQELNDKNAEIDRLKAEIEELKNSLIVTKPINYGATQSSDQNILSEEDVSILNIISLRDDDIDTNKIQEALKMNRVLLEFHLEELINSGYLKVRFDLNGNGIYSLLQKGRKYILYMQKK